MLGSTGDAMVATWSGLGVEEHDARRRQIGQRVHRPCRSRSGRRGRGGTRRGRCVIAADPPCAIGQVSTWPVSRKSRPTAALTGRVSGRTECAAQPASRARARSPRNHVWPSTVAGSSAGTPKRASTSGCRGRCAGPRISAISSSRVVEEGADQPAVRGRVRSERARRSRRSTCGGSPPAHRRAGARPTPAAGSRSARARRAGASRGNGERMPSGWAAEQTSW